MAESGTHTSGRYLVCVCVCFHPIINYDICVAGLVATVCSGSAITKQHTSHPHPSHKSPTTNVHYHNCMYVPTQQRGGRREVKIAQGSGREENEAPRDRGRDRETGETSEGTDGRPVSSQAAQQVRLS